MNIYEVYFFIIKSFLQYVSNTLFPVLTQVYPAG